MNFNPFGDIDFGLKAKFQLKLKFFWNTKNPNQVYFKISKDAYPNAIFYFLHGVL